MQTAAQSQDGSLCIDGFPSRLFLVRVQRLWFRNSLNPKMIKFVLMVNKQGQTRLAQYYDFLTIEERVALEAETIRKCLTRNELQVLFSSTFC